MTHGAYITNLTAWMRMALLLPTKERMDSTTTPITLLTMRLSVRPPRPTPFRFAALKFESAVMNRQAGKCDR